MASSDIEDTKCGWRMMKEEEAILWKQREKERNHRHRKIRGSVRSLILPDLSRAMNIRKYVRRHLPILLHINSFLEKQRTQFFGPKCEKRREMGFNWRCGEGEGQHVWEGSILRGHVRATQFSFPGLFHPFWPQMRSNVSSKFANQVSKKIELSSS